MNLILPVLEYCPFTDTFNILRENSNDIEIELFTSAGEEPVYFNIFVIFTFEYVDLPCCLRCCSQEIYSKTEIVLN